MCQLLGYFWKYGLLNLITPKGNDKYTGLAMIRIHLTMSAAMKFSQFEACPLSNTNLSYCSLADVCSIEMATYRTGQYEALYCATPISLLQHLYLNMI